MSNIWEPTYAVKLPLCLLVAPRFWSLREIMSEICDQAMYHLMLIQFPKRGFL